MKFTSVSKLKPGMRIGQSIIGITGAEHYVLGTVLTEQDIAFFEENGFSGIYTLEAQPTEILSPALMQHCLQAVKKLAIQVFSEILIKRKGLLKIPGGDMNGNFASSF